jgi:transcription elongation factor Elf1
MFTFLEDFEIEASCPVCNHYFGKKTVKAESEEEAIEKAKQMLRRKFKVCPQCERSTNLTEKEVKIERANYQTEVTAREEARLAESKKTQEEAQSKTNEELEEIRHLRMRHRFLILVKNNLSKFYLRILEGCDGGLTAGEMWRKAKDWTTVSGMVFHLDEGDFILKLTEKEFYEIFGRSEMTMSNNRLSKIVRKLQKHSSIEVTKISAKGSPLKYRYIGKN